MKISSIVVKNTTPTQISEEAHDATHLNASSAQKPKLIAMHFFNVPDSATAAAKQAGLKQTKQGRWYKGEYTISNAAKLQRDLSLLAHTFGPAKRSQISANESEQHHNSKPYDKCWEGHRKAPSKRRGEKGSCVKEHNVSLLDEGYKEATQEFQAEADADAVKKAIDAFKVLVNRNQVQGNERNIDWWRKQGWQQFSAYVNDKQNTISTTQLKQQRKKVGKSITLDENNDWLIVVPLDKDASCFHGRDTDWCTTKPFATHFEDYFYRDEITLIYFLQKETGDKWAIATHHELDKIELFDRNDKSITETEFQQQTGINPTKYIQAAHNDANKPKITGARAEYQALVKRGEELLASIDVTESSAEMEKIIINTKNKELTERYVNEYRDYSDAFLRVALSINGMLIEALRKKGTHVPEALQLIAVREDGNSIVYIRNPSEAVQLVAVKQNGLVLQTIQDPSEAVQLAAVKQNGLAILRIRQIEDPSEAVQLAAVQQNGYVIGHILKYDPSEEVQLAAVQQNPAAIRHIPNPSDAVKQAAGLTESKSSSALIELRKLAGL